MNLIHVEPTNSAGGGRHMFREQLSAGIITITGLLLVGLNIGGDSSPLWGIAKGSLLVGLGILMAHSSSRLVGSSRFVGSSEPRV